MKIKGTGGRFTAFFPQGGGGGSPLNPLAPTDSRPATLLNVAGALGSATFASAAISPGVDSASRGSSYYSAYYVFQLNPGDEGDYTFEITAGTFDTYMYLHSTANSDEYSFLNTVTEDDDSGSPPLSRFTWTYDGLAPFTGGIEVTSYSAGTSGTFTLTVTGVGVVEAVSYDGTPVAPGDTITFNNESSRSLTTTYANTAYSITQSGSPIASGNMPIDLQTLGLADGSYDVVASGVSFSLVVTARLYIDYVVGVDPDIAQDGYYYYQRGTNSGILSTTYVNTTYTANYTGSLTSTGNMPFSLQDLPCNPEHGAPPTLVQVYAMTGSGVSFDLEVRGGLTLQTGLGIPATPTVDLSYGQTYQYAEGKTRYLRSYYSGQGYEINLAGSPFATGDMFGALELSTLSLVAGNTYSVTASNYRFDLSVIEPPSGIFIYRFTNYGDPSYVNYINVQDGGTYTLDFAAYGKHTLGRSFTVFSGGSYSISDGVNPPISTGTMPKILDDIGALTNGSWTVTAARASTYGGGTLTFTIVVTNKP